MEDRYIKLSQALEVLDSCACWWAHDRMERIPAADVQPVDACQYRRIKRRTVYRGDVYNAIEAERIIHLDGILTDRYKDGFHDGLKRALEILGGLPDTEEGE